MERKEHLFALLSDICHFPNRFCLSSTETLRADAHQNGFQALQQRDYKSALYYLSFFAANGDFRAHYNLGIMYRDGLGVKKNDVQSLAHFLEAAESGHMFGKLRCWSSFFNRKRQLH